MSRIQGNYGNLIQGVSSQPDNFKLAGQMKEIVNCRANVIKGIEKRAGFNEVVSQPPTYSFTDYDNAQFELQDKGDGTAVIIAVQDEEVKALRYDGTTVAPLPVVYQQGTVGSGENETTIEAQIRNYLQSDNPREDFVMNSVLDTTFIVNNKFIPQGNDSVDYIFDASDQEGFNLRHTWLEFGAQDVGGGVELSIIAYYQDAEGNLDPDTYSTMHYGPIRIWGGVEDDHLDVNSTDYDGSGKNPDNQNGWYHATRVFNKLSGLHEFSGEAEDDFGIPVNLV